MPEVLHKEPPIRTVQVRSGEGVKVIHVRRRPKQRKPKTPTGDVLRCPFCSKEHPVMVAGNRRLLMFKCPEIDAAPLFCSHRAQEYLRTLIVSPTPKGRREVREALAESAPEPAPEPAPKPASERKFDEVKKLLKEAIESAG